jgi:hypothetical protein
VANAYRHTNQYVNTAFIFSKNILFEKSPLPTVAAGSCKAEKDLTVSRAARNFFTNNSLELITQKKVQYMCWKKGKLGIRRNGCNNG